MPVAAVGDQRGRILDAALELMGQQGSAGASMRQLATACHLNVASLYHYFPSKADLLRAVLDERRYGERLARDTPPVDRSAPPRQRLAGLLRWLWASALEEEAVWRLLVGEAIRGGTEATASARGVVEALAVTLEGWLDQGFPELEGDHGALARVIRGQVFALVVEHLALGEVTPAVAGQRADELAALLVPESTTLRP